MGRPGEGPRGVDGQRQMCSAGLISASPIFHGRILATCPPHRKYLFRRSWDQSLRQEGSRFGLSSHVDVTFFPIFLALEMEHAHDPCPCGLDCVKKIPKETTARNGWQGATRQALSTRAVNLAYLASALSYLAHQNASIGANAAPTLCKACSSDQSLSA